MTALEKTKEVGGELGRRKLETLAVAVGLAALIAVGNALLTLDAEALDNPGDWIRSAVVGLAGAVGGVIVGFSRR